MLRSFKTVSWSIIYKNRLNKAISYIVTPEVARVEVSPVPDNSGVQAIMNYN